ncbi:MAG: MBL fold metallo-hydrolase [Herpetosiphonaceae bacterium]|nr:MBL fold metallo-hydrolase [Herpetosiphonaceae bacterium]
MTAKQLVPGVYAISLGFVNTFVIDAGELTLIDTGLAGSASRILAALRQLGRQPADLQHIILTHCHADHTGSLRKLQQESGAIIFMHPVDAALVGEGQASRPVRPAPGLMNAVVFQLMMMRQSSVATVEPVTVDHEVQDGEELPIAGGLQVIATPGHTVGHISLLLPQHGGVLFVGDAAGNMFGLSYSPIYEDLDAGQHSLGQLATLEFDVACFGHGRAIIGGAAAQFRQKWGRIAPPITRR